MGASARVVYFDLDGVLVDSRPGIVACVAHVLRELAGAEIGARRIERIIGPPLQVGFAELLAEIGRLGADTGPYVARYRELYTAVATNGGTALQPGIVAMLADLAPQATLAVATSKPLRFAEPILQTLGIRPLFTVVAAPEPHTDGESKTETLRRAIALTTGDETDVRAWMIGDRSHDIVAAHACGVTAVGATWGFGSEAELRDAGADIVVRAPAELVPALFDSLSTARWA